ncbi:MAG: DUF1002 domain-containing protein [Lachnospiraceae bacterium]|nr:DUF1002 domain-containing protein [Lachnospiraceae bacterium]
MKRKLLSLIMSAICLTAAIPSTLVFADGQKVVTLGADLSEDQKNAILRYFGVAGQNIQTLTITNQDERNHLGSYVPLEQIGTHTYSCALVCPTTSGGIQVKTANLSWVTSNMIASTLSTSGVVNCDVLAAAPFEVSGTGALTGILMAYESASGEQLDETKKEIATQEMITTTTIANTIGQQQATEIVNDTKMQVIQGNQVNQETTNDIDVIINQVAQEKNISLSDEDRQLLQDLLEEIADQNYNYDDMKETLERVEQNVNNNIDDSQVIGSTDDTAQDAAANTAQTETPETLAPDSILKNTDESALGDNVNFDATDSSALDQTEAQQTEATQTETTPSGEFEITTSDNYSDSEAQTEATTESQSETTGAESGDLVTSDIEMIPLSDFVLSPVTSEATNYKVYPAGLQELTVSFERNDIVAGSGTVSVYNAVDSSLVETVNMDDEKKVAISPLDDDELNDLGWTEGYKAVLTLSEPLAQNATYFVAMSQDAFSTEDGRGSSEATPDSYTWMFQTSPYGFSITPAEDGYKAGTTATATILMDGSDAGYATIENVDESLLSFDQNEFWATGNLTASFLASGETTFQVAFYDVAGGNLLYTMDYSVEIN